MRSDSYENVMKDTNDHLLPSVFNEIVGDDTVTFKWKNEASTFYLEGKNGTNKYLKVQSIVNTESLKVQAKKLNWLKDKLTVPYVLDYGTIGKYEYMLTSEIVGREASSHFFVTNAQGLMAVTARGLREIHSIPINECPFDNRLNTQLLIARENYENKRINVKEVIRKHGKDDLDKLMKELDVMSREFVEDLVVIHGDYSLPNILIHDGAISGFIDLGYCGISDRYYDLAVAENSIIRNFGAEYVDLFYREYGIENVNRKKIKFYQLLEDFIWV